MPNTICENCKTGRELYLLDPHSELCPYIECWKENKCPYYVPFSEKPGYSDKKQQC